MNTETVRNIYVCKAVRHGPAGIEATNVLLEMIANLAIHSRILSCFFLHKSLILNVSFKIPFYSIAQTKHRHKSTF